MIVSFKLDVRMRDLTREPPRTLNGVVPIAQREPFMALRTNVESWASRGMLWAQRGSEHAANVIAWGVLGDPFPVSRTSPDDPDGFRNACRYLTGMDPLHDGRVPIQRPDRDTLPQNQSNHPLELGR